MTKFFVFCSAALFACALLTTPAHADGGADIWAKKCSNCHGADGKGQTKMGKKMKVGDMSTAEWQQKNTDDVIKKTLAEGINRTVEGTKQKMDAFKDLTAEQVADLIKKLRSLAAAP